MAAEETEQRAERRGIERRLRSPLVVILLLAPFLGESLSTSTPPLDLLLPWNLALMVALYGCGALICREVARRLGLGFLGLVLLGVAYGVYEEALVDRFWFSRTFWDDVEVGTYSEVWHTNVLLAAHLTLFHTVVSICCSVLLVERLFPAARDRPWVGGRGLTFAALGLVVVAPIFAAEFSRPPAVVLVAAAVLFLALVGLALLAPRLPRWRPLPPRDRRRGLAWVAFVCTGGQFLLTYAVPTMGVPWPVGVAISLAPVVVGVVLVRRLASTGPYGSDGLRVVSGILWFFIVLDVAVGLGGRYDLSLGALALGWFLWRLSRFPGRMTT